MLGFHGLRQNDDLTPAEYARIKSHVAEVNGLVHLWPGYVESHGLDSAVFHTQNEWAEIIKVSQADVVSYPDSYRAVNYARLMSPFTGFHLPFLDRLDGFRRFDNAQTDAIKLAIEHGIPENIADLMDSLDPHERLSHVVSEQRKLTENLPGKYIFRPPGRCGEVGLVIDGAIVNPDTLITQARINSLYNAGLLASVERRIAKSGTCRILEVGAGYGALATALHFLYPGKIEYIIIELPNVLWNAVIYMTATDHERMTYLLNPGAAFPSHFRTVLVAHYLTEEFRSYFRHVDLAINTMSFIEMSKAQVIHYRDLMRESLSPEGACFIEGTPTKPHHIDCGALFSETMPIRIDVPQTPVYRGAVESISWTKGSL